MQGKDSGTTVITVKMIGAEAVRCRYDVIGVDRRSDNKANCLPHTSSCEYCNEIRSMVLPGDLAACGMCCMLSLVLFLGEKDEATAREREKKPTERKNKYLYQRETFFSF